MIVKPAPTQELRWGFDVAIEAAFGFHQLLSEVGSRPHIYAEDVVGGLKLLSSLKRDHPALTIVIIHHVRKERSDTPRKLMADPRLWTDAVSGHHALSSHVDGCFGLERERDEDGEEWIVFGGVARNVEPRTILLDEDEDTLRFAVRQNEDAL